MSEPQNLSLSRVAEGIGPKTPGNLDDCQALQQAAEKVLNPTEFFLKDEEACRNRKPLFREVFIFAG